MCLTIVERCWNRCDRNVPVAEAAVAGSKRTLVWHRCAISGTVAAPPDDLGRSGYQREACFSSCVRFRSGRYGGCWKARRCLRPAKKQRNGSGVAWGWGGADDRAWLTAGDPIIQGNRTSRPSTRAMRAVPRGGRDGHGERGLRRQADQGHGASSRNSQPLPASASQRAGFVSDSRLRANPTAASRWSRASVLRGSPNSKCCPRMLSR